MKGINWKVEGPMVLDWLREYLKSHGERGALTACWYAFRSHGLTPDALYNYLGRQAKAEWATIKANARGEAPPSEVPKPEPVPSAPAAPPTLTQEVTQTQKDDGEFEARANGAKIRTVADLIGYIEADMTRFEIASSEATKYEGLTKDMEGKPVVTEMFRVFVRLRPLKGPSPKEIVDALLGAAFKTRTPPRIPALPKRAGDIWQVVVVADPHFGKRAWRGSTGGPDYDLAIAQRCVADAGAELVARGDQSYRVARRTIAILGDVFHYDTPGGTTTSGTAMERDGRYQKMIDVGVDTCIGVIEQSAASVPTDVILVPGNHDEVLSCALQRILRERFRLDKRVTVDDGHTSRKYLTWGANLIGIAHGDKAKKKLPQLMAIERPDLWGASTYREIHTGHLHYQAAEWQRPIETIDGVIVRIAPSLGPADDWHAANGFLGAVRGMETFFYRQTGGLAAMFVSSAPEAVAA